MLLFLLSNNRLIHDRFSVFRRSYLVKREAQDGKNVSRSILVCEIRDTLHEIPACERFFDEPL